MFRARRRSDTFDENCLFPNSKYSHVHRHSQSKYCLPNHSGGNVWASSDSISKAFLLIAPDIKNKVHSERWKSTSCEAGLNVTHRKSGENCRVTKVFFSIEKQKIHIELEAFICIRLHFIFRFRFVINKQFYSKYLKNRSYTPQQPTVLCKFVFCQCG
jgi:hypothetical protein